MPTCVLRYCKSRSGGPEPNWSFFSFPPVGNKSRKEWIRFVQKERREDNWQPSSASKLCSKHFKHKDIKVGKTGRACLKKGSLPYDKPGEKPKPDSAESDDETDSKSVSECESDSKRLSNDVLDLKPVANVNADTKISIGDDDDVDDDDVDDNDGNDRPKEVLLKARVEKLQKVRRRQREKILKLDHQNQLLKQKLSKLKNFVINLVKKYDLQITGQMQIEPRKDCNL